MGRARGPSTGGPRHALLGHGPRPLLGRPVGPRPLMRPAGTVDHVNFCVNMCIVILLYQSTLFSYPGLSLRGGGQGFPPATYYKCDPRLLLLENRRKIEPKVAPSCLIPHLLVVFTQQLGILVTILHLLPCIIKISFDTCTLRKIIV